MSVFTQTMAYSQTPFLERGFNVYINHLQAVLIAHCFVCKAAGDCFCIFYIIKCFFIYFYFVLFSVCLFVKLCMPCLCVFFNIGEVPWHCTEHLPRFSQRQAPAIVWRIVGEPWNSIVAIRRKEVIERSEGALTQTWNLWLTFYSFLFCFILVIKLGTTLYSPITVLFYWV